MLLFNSKKVVPVIKDNESESNDDGDLGMIADQFMEAMKSESREGVLDALEAFKAHIMAEDEEQDQSMTR